MRRSLPAVGRGEQRRKNTEAGSSNCIACGKHLAYCGKPFSADLKCPNCGAVNIYEESQQPTRLRDVQQQ